MTMINTSAAKRIAALILTFMLVFTMNLFTIRTARAEETFDATFQISVHQNWIKSRYGVTIYLDGVVVEHVKQGDMITFGARLTNGWHELTFVPGKSTAETRSWKIGYLRGGYVVTCTLQTHSKDIEIRETNLTDGSGNKVTFSQSRDGDLIGKVVDVAGKAVVTYVKIKSGK